MRVAVIGAGPAGLTTAYRLAQAGVSVDVFEASGSVGGLCKTIRLWDQKVDLGPHRFFSNDRRVNALWLEVVGRDYAMVDRLTRIYFDGRFFQYPLKAGNALRNLGPVEAAQCILSYLQSKGTAPAEDASFEEWVVARFGRRLFEIFFKTYSEKLWGIPCTELDADFAAQRIKKLSLSEALKSAVLNGRGSKHKTLVDRFAYPLEGTGVVYDRMAISVQRLGGRVRLNTPIERVTMANGRASGIALRNGGELPYDHVVSTMPLTLMVKGLEGVPPEVSEHARRLRFRNTLLVYLNVGATRLFPDNWLYVHDARLKTGRITNFRNWVPELYGAEQTSILSMEYWCNDGEPMWEADESSLVRLASDELRKTGLIGDAPVLNGRVVRIRRCYPVYDRYYKTHLRPVEEYLSGIDGLSVIGRYGAFKYNNQDHSILMGLLAAENILSGSANELWSINTDYETYQEEALITETGLVAV